MDWSDQANGLTGVGGVLAKPSGIHSLDGEKVVASLCQKACDSSSCQREQDLEEKHWMQRLSSNRPTGSKSHGLIPVFLLSKVGNCPTSNEVDFLHGSLSILCLMYRPLVWVTRMYMFNRITLESALRLADYSAGHAKIG